MIFCRNYDRCRLFRLFSASCKYTFPNLVLLRSLEQAAGGIGLYVDANKTVSMCFQQGSISTLSGWPLKLVDKFT